jgi:hypothetical protein
MAEGHRPVPVEARKGNLGIDCLTQEYIFAASSPQKHSPSKENLFRSGQRQLPSSFTEMKKVLLELTEFSITFSMQPPSPRPA